MVQLCNAGKWERVTVIRGGQNYSKEEKEGMLLGHLTKLKKKNNNLDRDRSRNWLTTNEQMGHDKLTAIWRKASSLLASFDDELA